MTYPDCLSGNVLCRLGDIKDKLPILRNTRSSSLLSAYLALKCQLCVGSPIEMLSDDSAERMEMD